MKTNQPQKNIISNWQQVKLGDLCKDMIQGVNTAIDIPEYVKQDGIFMLKANDIIDGQIDFSNIEQISHNTYSRYSDRFKIKKGDFLFSNIGARLGTGSLFDKDVDVSFAWNVMRMIPNQLIISEYLYYKLNSKSFYNLVIKHQSGSGMPFIPKKTLREN